MCAPGGPSLEGNVAPGGPSLEGNVAPGGPSLEGNVAPGGPSLGGSEAPGGPSHGEGVSPDMKGVASGTALGCSLLKENVAFSGNAYKVVELTDSPYTKEVPMWISSLNLTESDKILLEHGGCLNDQIIFSAQKLLQNKFPGIQGWQSTHCSYTNRLFKPISDSADYIQILLTRGNHWITVSNILRYNKRPGGATFVAIYDSLRGLYIEHKLKCDVAFFVHSNLDKLEFNIMNVDGQLNLTDCGVYAIAYATHLAHGLDPTVSLWHHKEMRNHLISCLKEGEMTCFPSEGDRSLR